MSNQSLIPHNPNFMNNYPDWVYYMDDSTGFGRVLSMLEVWNKDMEHNNGIG
jgi:hypothetical protein